MYPHERSLVKRLEGKPFALVGINTDPKGHLKQVIKKEKMTWRSWWDGGDPSGPIASKWNVRSWPTTYVLDHKGVIRYRDVREEAMDQAVDKLLQELGSEQASKKQAAN